MYQVEPTHSALFSMKKLLVLLAGFALIVCPLTFAQPSAPLPPSALNSAASKLTKFSLDFPGGTPGELVIAIQKAMGRPLNVVIPVEHAGWRLPPLKMSGINVMQLFSALEVAGPRRQIVGRQQIDSSYSFRTNQALALDDDSVWSFYVNTQPLPPKVVRFYLLTPYLEAGLTVDDITTAIQTSWRMLEDKDSPTLSFHKETKMLIAVGDYSGLETIDLALKTLDAIRNKAPAPKPAEEKKTKS